MKNSIIPSLSTLVSITGFILVVGAAGGLEKGNATFAEGIIIAIIGLTMMYFGYKVSRKFM